MSRKYAHSTLTLMAILKCVVLQPVGTSAYKFGGKSALALDRERQVLQRGKTLRSVGKIGSGHESSTLWARSTCLPLLPTEICVTRTETGKNHHGKCNHMAFWA